MHILILADTIDNQRAGIHVYTKRLIEELVKIGGHEYTFIHERKNDFFKGLNHHIIPRKNRLGYGTYRKFFLIPRLLRKLKPDIVFEPCHIGPFRTKAKKVVMIHDLSPILMPQFHIKRSTIVHRLLLRHVLKNADLILTASKSTKKNILKYSKTKAKIEVIPLGIDGPASVRHSTRADDSRRKKLPHQILCRQHLPYLLYLGTIEPRKNLKTLIDTFIELKKSKKLRKYKLILAGEIGWKSENILKKAAGHKDIIVTSYVDEEEKSQLYRNAQIFIYPSLHEGFGLPPLEAMSYGLPVIAADNSSLREIFKNHASMFPAKNKKQLKKLILKLSQNKKLREKLGRQGQAYAKKFTWKKTAEKTLRAFEKLSNRL